MEWCGTLSHLLYVAAMTRLPFGLGAFVLLCFGPTVWFSLPDAEMSVRTNLFSFMLTSIDSCY